MKLNFPAPGARLRAMARGNAHLWRVLDQKLEMLRMADGELTEKIRLAENAAGVARKAFGPNHPNLALSLEKLGDLSMANDERDGAESCYREALVAHAANHDLPAIARIAGNLAWVCTLQENPTDAKRFYEQAITATETLSLPAQNLAHLFNNLAGVCHGLGCHEEAELHYLRAIAICESLHDRYHPNLASLTTNLGVFYCARGEPEKAVAKHLQALIIREQICEPSDPLLAQTLGNLAAAYHAGGELAKAEALYEKAIAMFEQHE